MPDGPGHSGLGSSKRITRPTVPLQVMTEAVPVQLWPENRVTLRTMLGGAWEGLWERKTAQGLCAFVSVTLL